jgi:hypothetical protein
MITRHYDRLRRQEISEVIMMVIIRPGIYRPTPPCASAPGLAAPRLAPSHVPPPSPPPNAPLVWGLAPEPAIVIRFSDEMPRHKKRRAAKGNALQPKFPNSDENMAESNGENFYWLICIGTMI